MDTVKEITRDEIRERINQEITDYTGYPGKFDSIEDAIEASVQSIHEKANDFEVLTQEIIDDQKDEYDGYLDGAEVGDLVWCDSEMYVSQGTVEAWHYAESSEASGKHLDIEDIESLVCDSLIIGRLDAHNKKAR